MTRAILPVRDDYWVCETHPQITPMMRLGPPFDAGLPAIWTSDDTHVAWTEDRVIVICGMREKVVRRYPLPDEVVRVQCLKLAGNYLFAGTVSDDAPSRILAFNLHHDVTFHLLGPDGVIGAPDQPIVTIDADGDQLFAIDAGFAPKLMYVYAVSPHGIEQRTSVRIPSGIDDHVQRIAFGRSFIFVLSSTIHKDAKAWKIGVYERHSLDEITTFFHRVPWQQAFNPPLEILGFQDLLLMAHGPLGLGIVRLDDGQRTRFGHYPAVQPWSRPTIGVKSITYASSFSTGRVTDVHAVVQNDQALVTLHHGSRRWWEVVGL